MLLPAYTRDELSFSFRCYVYFRWHSYRRQSVAELERLTANQLETTHPEIRVLELTTSETEVVLLASLRPTDSVSVAASKLKGAASKSLRQLGGLSEPARILGGGYFAATTGANTSDELGRYLEQQGEHHRYDGWVNPPVWVQTWPLSDEDQAALQTPHAVTIVRWHVVLSTWDRRGAFTPQAAQAICQCWAQQGRGWRVRFHKVSVVPDHVHVAVWSHPTLAPAELVVQLLNTSQSIMRDKFDNLLIRAGVPRLWKPSAYVGSYGDISKDHIRNYLRKWGAAAG
jgi:REP element-mobilizing transposase RayT